MGRRESSTEGLGRERPFPQFAVACGEEASDPWVWHGGQMLRVDELAASGHIARRDKDLADVASLGVKVWRYGVPWRQTEVEPGRYDWSQWDAALAACERHGLEPVIDLLHFGLPDHLSGFCDPSWVEPFLRYVDAFLVRYRDPMWFTPINEPGITATFSALWGIWNDRRASRADYGTALGNLVRANLEAITRIRADRDGWWIGAEGFSLFIANGNGGPGDEATQQRAADARAVQQLVWDLHFGLEPPSSVSDIVGAIDDSTRSRIAELACGTHHVVAGHDVYPVAVERFDGGEIADLSLVDRARAYGDEARRWHDRYGADFWVAETSNLGFPHERQDEWLSALMATLEELIVEGRPVRGVCWYSRGDQYDWDTALVEPVGRVTEVGLFDTDRRARPVASSYARVASQHADRGHS